jgi:hypothetical protein
VIDQGPKEKVRSKLTDYRDKRGGALAKLLELLESLSTSTSSDWSSACNTARSSLESFKSTSESEKVPLDEVGLDEFYKREAALWAHLGESTLDQRHDTIVKFYASVPQLTESVRKQWAELLTDDVVVHEALLNSMGEVSKRIQAVKEKIKESKLEIATTVVLTAAHASVITKLLFLGLEILKEAEAKITKEEREALEKAIQVFTNYKQKHEIADRIERTLDNARSAYALDMAESLLTAETVTRLGDGRKFGEKALASLKKTADLADAKIKEFKEEHDGRLAGQLRSDVAALLADDGDKIATGEKVLEELLNSTTDDLTEVRTILETKFGKDNATVKAIVEVILKDSELTKSDLEKLVKVYRDLLDSEANNGIRK